MGANKEHEFVDLLASPGASTGTFCKEHGTFRCRRGYDLYTTTYTPAVRRTSACLIFHHGLSDHAERHSAVLSHLCVSLGMAVYTYDAHGHGRSGPDGTVGRALIRSFHHMVEDLIDFTRLFVVPAEQLAAAATAAEAPAGAEATEAAEAEVEVEVEDMQASSGGSGDESSEDGGEGGAGGSGGRGRARRAPRIFLLGYSMGGLTCCSAVAATSASSSSASSSSYSAPSAAAAAAAATPSRASSSSDATGSDAGASADEPSAPAATGDGGGAVAEDDDGGGSSLYAGLMLTSCLTDPLYGSSPLSRAVKMAYVTTLARLAPALPLFKRNPVESGIRDPKAVAEMAADTLWYRGKFKVVTIASLLWGCQRLRWTSHRIRLPLYVQHATVDTACSWPSMRAFLTRVRSADRTVHVVEGAYHDLHHDPETPVLLGRMVDWLRPRV